MGLAIETGFLADMLANDPEGVEEFEGEEYSWRADDEAKAEFSRLSGHGWAHSWKVSKGASTQCDTDEDDFDFRHGPRVLRRGQRHRPLERYAEEVGLDGGDAHGRDYSPR